MDDSYTTSPHKEIEKLCKMTNVRYESYAPKECLQMIIEQLEMFGYPTKKRSK